MLLQLEGKRDPLKALRKLKGGKMKKNQTKTKKGSKKERKKEKKKITPFRKKLLGSIRPFLGLIQFYRLGAINPMGSPWKQGNYNHRSE